MGEGPIEESWLPTLTVSQTCQRIRAAERVVVLTHVRPDGDAVGSSMGLVRALSRMRRAAQLVYCGLLPRWLPDLLEDTTYSHVPLGEHIDDAHLGACVDPDLIVLTDTGSWSQLEEVRGLLERYPDRIIIVDHHLHGDSDVSQSRLLDTSAAATTQIMARVVCELLDLDDPNQIPTDIASGLYLGLATDTGWFRHSNVSGAAMRLGASLIEAGIAHTELYSLVEQQDSPGRWRLLGRALGNMTLSDDGRIAIMSLRQQDFKDASASNNDTGGYADMLLSISTVRVSAVVVEAPPGNDGLPITKVSLRSKPIGEAIDVNEIARRLGGGGHARAAGVRLRLQYEEALARVTEALT